MNHGFCFAQSLLEIPKGRCKVRKAQRKRVICRLNRRKLLYVINLTIINEILEIYTDYPLYHVCSITDDIVHQCLAFSQLPITYTLIKNGYDLNAIFDLANFQNISHCCTVIW
jgi:hypothetical protein